MFQIRFIIILNTFLVHDTKIATEKMFILAICFSRYKRWLNLSCFYFHLIIYIKFFIVLKKNFIIIKEVGHYAVLFFLHSPTNPDCCWLSRGWGLGRELRCLTDGQQAPTPAVEVNEDGPICPTQPPHWLVDLHSDVPHVGVRNLINKAIYLSFNDTFKSFFKYRSESVLVEKIIKSFSIMQTLTRIKIIKFVCKIIT